MIKGSFINRHKIHTLLEDLDLSSYDLKNAIGAHQGRAWGMSEEAPEEAIFQKIYQHINSEMKLCDFFYKGDLFRIHVPASTLASKINPEIEFRSGPISDDGSCKVLPITRYEDTLRGFSKSYDFTLSKYYKIQQDEKAVFLYCNTGNMCGIDINFLSRNIGCLNSRFEYENEVLFPVQKEYIIEEYVCTPTEFKIKMNKYFATN